MNLENRKAGTEMNSKDAKARREGSQHLATGQIADSPAGNCAGYTEAALLPLFASFASSLFQLSSAFK